MNCVTSNKRVVECMGFSMQLLLQLCTSCLKILATMATLKASMQGFSSNTGFPKSLQSQRTEKQIYRNIKMSHFQELNLIHIWWIQFKFVSILWNIFFNVIMIFCWLKKGWMDLGGVDCVFNWTNRTCKICAYFSNVNSTFNHCINIIIINEKTTTPSSYFVSYVIRMFFPETQYLAH